MQVIVFNVKHSRLVRYTSGVIASDSYEHLKFQFNFNTDDWQKASIKTANFQYGTKTYPIELDENNQVLVPAAVLNAPAFKVSIFGGGMTTQSVKIPVHDCGISNPGTDFEPDETIGEIINKITAIVDAKADALVFNEEDKTIQLASNGKPICDKVPVDVDGIDRCYINDDANLIVCLQDGSTINVGQVVDTHGNNYTLASNGAEANIIEVVKVNGTALPVVNKTVDVTVPTGVMASKDNVSKDDLTNDLKVEIEGKLDASKVTGDMLTHNASEFALAEHSHKIPTSTSELTNDSGFITKNDIPDVPTKTSELANDSGFITVDDISGKANQSYVDDKLAKKVDVVTYNADKANFALKSELYDDTVLAGKVAAIEDDYLKAADKKDLQEQITTNANAITLLTDGVDASKVDGVKDLIDYVDKHGAEVTGIKKDIAANAAAIAEKADVDHSHSEYAILGEDGKVSEDQLPEIPSQNVLIATSVEEMDALLVADNIGKMVTYIGESTSGGLVGTPFEVGDEFSVAYVDVNSEPDLFGLNYIYEDDNPVGMCELFYAPDVDETSAQYMSVAAAKTLTPNGDDCYIIAIAQYHGTIWYYASADMPDFGLIKGWQTPDYENGGIWVPATYSNFDMSSLYNRPLTVKVERLEYADFLSQFLSKTPFVEGGGAYEKDSVYIITDDNGEIIAKSLVPEIPEIPEIPDIPEQNTFVAKTEEEMNALLTAENQGAIISYIGEGKRYVGTPFEVGDEVTRVYFNTSSDIDYDFASLDYTPGDTTDGVPVFVISDANTGEELVVLAAIRSDNFISEITGGAVQGHLYMLYLTINGSTDVVYYHCDADITPQEVGAPFEEWGWLPEYAEQLANGYDMSADITPEQNVVVSEMIQKDKLATFISKTPFIQEGNYLANTLYMVLEDKNNSGNYIADLVHKEPKIYIPKELPEVESWQSGSFLKVNSDGKWDVGSAVVDVKIVDANSNYSLINYENGERVAYIPRDIFVFDYTDTPPESYIIGDNVGKLISTYRNVYLVAEAEFTTYNPVKVGEIVDKLYIDTSKEKLAWYPAFIDMDFSNADEDGRVGLLKTDDGETILSVKKFDLAELSNQRFEGYLYVVYLGADQEPILASCSCAAMWILDELREHFDFEVLQTGYQTSWVKSDKIIDNRYVEINNQSPISEVNNEGNWGGYLRKDPFFIAKRVNATKTSELTNDSGFITVEDIPETPKQNMFVVKSSDEVRALMTEDNIGCTFTYLGEDFVNLTRDNVYIIGRFSTEPGDDSIWCKPVCDEDNFIQNIKSVDMWAGKASTLRYIDGDNGGVIWSDDIAFRDENGSELVKAAVSHKMPIKAGDGIEFDVDESSDAVVIKSSLPKITAADVGKFLRIDSNGNIVVESLLIGEDLSV